VQAEADAIVVELNHLDVHGVGYVDVSVVYRDRTVDQARLGRESVPEGLAEGDRVFVTKAVNMVVALRRAEPDPEPS
jgi:hypothetical protein